MNVYKTYASSLLLLNLFNIIIITKFMNIIGITRQVSEI